MWQLQSTMKKSAIESEIALKKLRAVSFHASLLCNNNVPDTQDNLLHYVSFVVCFLFQDEWWLKVLVRNMGDVFV